MQKPPRVTLFANTDWYLFNFRLSLAKRLQAEQAEVWVVCPDGPYRPRLEAEGLHWLPISLDRQGLNPFKDLLAAVRLSRELARIQPDLLHNFTLKSILVGTLAARRIGVPRIVNAVTGLGSMFSGTAPGYRLPRRLLQAFFRWTFGRPGIITIFQNPSDLGQLAPNPQHRARCRLIPGSGVNTDLFQQAPSFPDTPIVIMVSRLLRDKGVQDFCEAATEIRRTLPNAEFRVVGDRDPGNPGSYSSEEVEALKLRFPIVQFLGHREDMPALYRQASLAVLPSRYGEGVPRSLLEAASSGLPLVVSEGDGVREIVVEKENGRLLPPGDTQALALAVLEILSSPELMQRYGQRSRAMAVEGFSERSVLAATLATYWELGLPGEDPCR